jgi:Fe-S-cluster containining protein
MTKAGRGIKSYRQLIPLVDRLTKRLSSRHESQMQCRAGCRDCCMNLSLLPVEWFSIKMMLAEAGLFPEFRTDRSCGFLDEYGLCRIYFCRPLICRTHGLPLYYWGDEGPLVNFCELNFTEYRKGHRKFKIRDLLDMERLNRKLTKANARHIRETGYSGPLRMEMKELVSI